MTQETKANQGKGAIFDLDGTLLDSMGVWDQVDVDFLAKRGIEVPDDYMQKVAAMQFRQIAEYTIARFGLSDTPEALMEEWDHMARVMYATVVEAKPYAREYLAIVEGERRETGRGHVIAADAARTGHEACRHFRLFRRRGQCRRCWRHRQGLSRTYICWPRRSLGIEPSDCTVFEDLLVGMRSAKSVGMHVWAMHDDSSDADWSAICASGGRCHVRLPRRARHTVTVCIIA